jgi:deoxyribodipyrimidine photo-lyase
MFNLGKLSENPRVTVRRGGAPNLEGACVVYWMQRAQRGTDNSALDVAVAAANELGKPVVVFFAPVSLLAARESSSLAFPSPRHS